MAGVPVSIDVGASGTAGALPGFPDGYGCQWQLIGQTGAGGTFNVRFSVASGGGDETGCEVQAGSTAGPESTDHFPPGYLGGPDTSFEFVTDFSGGVGSIQQTADAEWRLTTTFKDPNSPTPYPLDWTWDTPHGRPNNLRQVHGHYKLYLTSVWSLVASATASFGYTSPDPITGDPVPHTGSVNASRSWNLGTIGDEVTIAALQVQLTAGFSLAAGLLSTQPRTSWATVTGHCTVGGHSSGGDLHSHDWPADDPDATPGPQTQSAGNTVTGFWPAFVGTGPGGNNYWTFPDVYAPVDVSTPDATGASRAVKSLPIFDATADGMTPFSASWLRTNTEGPTNNPLVPDGHLVANETVLLAVPLDAQRRHDQRDFYGVYERPWIIAAGAAAWAPFSLAHTAVPVDDMVSSHPNGSVNLAGGARNWTAGANTALAISGAYQMATVSGGAGSLYRDLWSDFADCEANPTVYRAALASTGLEGLAKGWMTGSFTEGISNREWYLAARRKIRAGMDVCNWGNHRWVKIVGKADTAGRTFTLRIHADAVTVADDFHLSPAPFVTDDHSGVDPGEEDRVITIARAPVTMDVTGLSFGTADTNVYVDLAEAAQRADCSLAHITRIEFADLEDGGTYSFKSVSLAKGKAGAAHVVDEAHADFRFWTGVPYADDGCLMPVADGRPGCLMDAWDVGSGASPWVVTSVMRAVQTDYDQIVGPIYGLYNPRGCDEARNITEIIALLNLQEGLTATRVDDPPLDIGYAGEWALYLDAGWHTTNAGATVRLADVEVPAGLYAPWQGIDVLRGAAALTTFDAATRWPAAGQAVTCEGIRADASRERVTEGDGASDDNGGILVGPLPMGGEGMWGAVLDQHTWTDLDGTHHEWPAGITAESYFDGGYVWTATGLGGDAPGTLVESGGP